MKKQYKELSCVYDTRKSFYGKARTTEKDGITILYSYSSKVCEFDHNSNTYKVNGKIKSKLLYSHTTLRHIKEFIKQMLDKDIKITKSDIVKNTYCGK